MRASIYTRELVWALLFFAAIPAVIIGLNSALSVAPVLETEMLDQIIVQTFPANETAITTISDRPRIQAFVSFLQKNKLGWHDYGQGAGPAPEYELDGLSRGKLKLRIDFGGLSEDGIGGWLGWENTHQFKKGSENKKIIALSCSLSKREYTEFLKALGLSWSNKTGLSTKNARNPGLDRPSGFFRERDIKCPSKYTKWTPEQ